ncbi:MAG: hypothetical protein NE327_09925, partial [Lentisphaeraceae bacterium]|nr:hypothetical protein [Lentisphaeraceae bacterium]
MKNLLFFLILSASLFFSCTQQKQEEEKTPTDNKTAVNSPHSFEDYEYITVSDALNPHISYALHNDGDLQIKIRAAHFNKIEPSVTLGISGKSKTVLSSDKAEKKTSKDTTDFLFKIDQSAIGTEGFKMAFEVKWYSEALKADVRKERFMHLNPAAAHSGLAENTDYWTAVSFKEYKQLV